MLSVSELESQRRRAIHSKEGEDTVENSRARESWRMD